MQWITEFFKSFGSEAPLFRNPGDALDSYNQSISNQNSEQAKKDNQLRLEEKEQANLNGEDPITGEKYELEVKKLKIKKDKKEEEWVKKEKSLVTITSLDDSTKFISSTLDTLCGGKYASLNTKPAVEIAEAISKDYNDIFTYVEASLANYSNQIGPKQAFRLAQSVAEDGKISHVDYEKLGSKLDKMGKSEFDGMLAESRVKVAYPLETVEEKPKVSIHTLENENLDLNYEEEMRNIKEEIEDQKEAAYKLQDNYYLAYIRDFQEYKVGAKEQLKERVSSVVSSLPSTERNNLITAMKGDKLLKDII